ncbi:hypothetical protein QE431_002038 [Flavobacterium sp. SORGH_AS 622]|nr:hypothetical protein [Flavobacterium sp. SORGH_AS_0622]
MIINLADTEIILSFAEEMAYNGHRFAAFNTDEVTDTNTIEFFEIHWMRRSTVWL